MKKLLSLLFLAFFVFSCSKDENRCTINGCYTSIPDGAVLYVTPVDDILSPIDSAVVKGGNFRFSFSDSVPVVRFISSQRVIDGNFVVVEPGVVNIDFTGDVFASGTPSNERLNRFMAEKEKIVDLGKMCDPKFFSAMALEETICDSIKEVYSFASDVFTVYALNEIMENLSTPVGCFYLMQSVGVVPAAKLQPLFDKVRVEYRDKLYDVMRKKVETQVRDAAMAERYLEDVMKSLEATAVGKDFQNFELDNIAGSKVLFSDEVFANKYTLVLFWAGWQDCIKEQLAMLADVYGRYKGKGLQIVGVSLDENVDDCKVLVDKLSIDWVQLCNPLGGSAEVAAAYGVTELPSAILVNRRGTIISRMTTVDDVVGKLEELF